jgi:hypothetical protein
VKKRNTDFSSFKCLLFQFHKRKSMFAVLQSDINSLKSGILHLAGQPFCKKSRSAKVKDGIINLFLRNYLVDQYNPSSLPLGPMYPIISLKGFVVNKIICQCKILY